MHRFGPIVSLTRGAGLTAFVTLFLGALEPLPGQVPPGYPGNAPAQTQQIPGSALPLPAPAPTQNPAYQNSLGPPRSPVVPGSPLGNRPGEGPEQIPRGAPPLVAGIRIVGNRSVPVESIRAKLRTRVDRELDPETIQADVRELLKWGKFNNVQTSTEMSPDGAVVTFQVDELPLIDYLHIYGNRQLSDKKLREESGLKQGEPLSTFRVNEARERIERFYQSKGFPKSQVMVLEGDNPDDRGVVLLVTEGNLQRIWSVRFEGNTIASDARLRTQIQSKPGILKYFFKGKVDRRAIEEDKERLTAYYRGLGFFNAKIGRELRADPSGKWLTITFLINEGPRYHLRNVDIIGNQKFDRVALLEKMQLKPGAPFHAARMQADLNTLLDAYGSEGHVFADIKADPRFLEEPGLLDLYYNVEEGDQYRVGRINIQIAGEYPHTKLNVVRNRISLQPGDVIDIRKIRESERRLRASQLFLVEPQRGIMPRISVIPPDLAKSAGSLAGRGATQTRQYRGQSPDKKSVRYLDLLLDLVPNLNSPTPSIDEAHKQ